MPLQIKLFDAVTAVQAAQKIDDFKTNYLIKEDQLKYQAQYAAIKAEYKALLMVAADAKFNPQVVYHTYENAVWSYDDKGMKVEIVSNYKDILLYNSDPVRNILTKFGDQPKLWAPPSLFDKNGDSYPPKTKAVPRTGGNIQFFVTGEGKVVLMPFSVSNYDKFDIGNPAHKSKLLGAVSDAKGEVASPNAGPAFERSLMILNALGEFK